jgi:hypothetical protein
VLAEVFGRFAVRAAATCTEPPRAE